MTDIWLQPDRVFDGDDLHQNMAVRVKDGHIADLAVSGDSQAQQARRVVGLITPGFVDLQVNGGGGVLLNNQPDLDGMRAIAAAHRRFGTVAIMPTVISDAFDVLDRAARAVTLASGDGCIVGLHIEGPHIAPEKRGTHAADVLRPLDDQTMSLVGSLRDQNVPVMITLAPEAATLAQIASLAKTGAIVSLGHSNATADMTRKAFDAGASAVTHLYNAMSPMQGRAPGLTGAAINSTAYVGIICDGLHVSDDMVGLAIRARAQPDRTFLVSDAMPTVGGPDYFKLYGSRIHLQDGRLINSDGNLAGAHVTQVEGVRRLVNHVGLSLLSALRMAITVPARVISKPSLSGLVGRNASDVIVLDEELRVTGNLSDISVIQNHPA